MPSFAGKTIWIIGASQGIGRALASALAAQGARLILSARNAQALTQLNAELGGGHTLLPLDVSVPNAIAAALEQLGAQLPDIAIFMAGVYTPMKLDALDLARTAEIVSTNLTAAILFVGQLFPRFKRRGHGHIVLCGSIAGYTGLPNGQPYSATKAGVNNLAESLAAEATGTNVKVQLICPGFVDTQMTRQNDFHMPARLTPVAAAQEIVKGLASNSFEIHFPRRMTWLAKLLRLLPYSLALPLLRRL